MSQLERKHAPCYHFLSAILEAVDVLMEEGDVQTEQQRFEYTQTLCASDIWQGTGTVLGFRRRKGS